MVTTISWLQIAEEWELPKDEGLERLWMIDSKQLQVALDDAGQPVLLGKGAYGAVCLSLQLQSTSAHSSI